MSTDSQFFGRRFLRFSELQEIGIVKHRSTLDRWVAEGRFPKPLKLGARVAVWDAEEIAKVIATRAAERDQVT
jgi:predicted DNA-binding transcriptional regulator AlpA